MSQLFCHSAIRKNLELMVIQLGKWFLTMLNFKGTLNSQRAGPSLGLIQQVALRVLFRVCLYESLMKSPITVAFWRAHCSVRLFTLFSLCSCRVPWHQEPSEPDSNSRFFYLHLPACATSSSWVGPLRITLLLFPSSQEGPLYKDGGRACLPT